MRMILKIHVISTEVKRSGEIAFFGPQKGSLHSRVRSVGMTRWGNSTPSGNGFTLIELMVAVGILAILATTGAAIFMRSLRGTSQIEIRRTLDDRAGLITNGLSRFFREAVVVSLDGQTRDACLAAGLINGNSLVVNAIDNLPTTFSVGASGLISSESANPVVINPESVTVGFQGVLTYYFTWYCSAGVPDRLEMRFNALSVSQQGDTSVNNDYIIDVTMRNSGQ